jgi:hypothetical protein
MTDQRDRTLKRTDRMAIELLNSLRNIFNAIINYKIPIEEVYE